MPPQVVRINQVDLDYVIAVRKQTEMLLAGPPLLLAATGEVATC